MVQVQQKHGLSKPNIFNNEYEIIRTLGEGSTSKVYYCKSIQNGDEVALKVFKPDFVRHQKNRECIR